MAAYRPGSYQSGKVFFAAQPDKPAAAAISMTALRLYRENMIGWQVPEDHLHATLHCLGAHRVVPVELRAFANAAANAVHMHPFGVKLERVMTFKRNASTQPTVLFGDDGDIGLRILWRSLGETLRDFGFGQFLGSSFTPHVTMFYDVRGITEQHVQPIEWTVREFVLIHSLDGDHIPLGYWPLKG